MNARDAYDRNAKATLPRRRRWPKVLAILAGLAVVFLIVVAHYLQPARLTALVLQRVSETLKLDLRTSGPGSYAWRPEPRLVLPGLSASVPGTNAPFFRSGQIELAVPWSTLRGRGSEISSIVMKSPDIDLPALQRWLASRPPSTTPFKLPRLTRGLRVENGLLRGAGWRIEKLDLVLPSLADGRPATLDASGNFVRGVMPSKFALSIVSTPAGQGRGLRVDKARIVLKADGELPSLTASGSMLAVNGVALDLAGKLQNMPATWSAYVDRAYAQPGDTPFSIALTSAQSTPQPANGSVPASAEAQNLQLRRFTFGDPARQPTLVLTGEAATLAAPEGNALAAGLRGQFSRWPSAWPALPEPLASSPAPIAFDATYRGPRNFSAPIAFNATRAATQLHGQFRIADIKAWLANKIGTLIPPIDAHMQTPTLEVGGMHLQGVQIDIHDDATPVSAPARTKPSGSASRL